MQAIKAYTQIYNDFDGQKMLEKIEQVARTCYKSEGKILIEGSTSMEPMVKALADDYQKQNPNAEIEVKATDSSRGITAVISGECDFAMSSRELKDYEAELLETKVIGKDAIAIVINEENPLENLTIKQLTGLYNGTYKNWDDLS